MKEHDPPQRYCDYSTEACIPTILPPLGSICIVPETHQIAET